MRFLYKIEGGNFAKAGHASSEVKKVLKELNLDAKVIKRTVIALYEAEVNVAAHAYSGEVRVEIEKGRIRVEVLDEGPGIADIEQAMQVGFSTASEKVRQMGFGAGMGLPNIKKNSNGMTLTSTPGKGTRLEFIIEYGN
jgi:serine/threonine-protein kinase RsbT